MPVPAAADINLVAVVPGNEGKVLVSVAGVHVVSHTSVAGTVGMKSLLARVFVPEVKVVFPSVTFQPPPDPVASPMSSVWVAGIVWVLPLSVVVEKVTLPGADAKDSGPGMSCRLDVMVFVP